MRAISFVRRHAPFAFWVVLYFAFLWPLFTMKKGFLAGDYAWQFYPWAHLYAQGIKHGLLPLWTPLIQAGFPLFAEGQTGMLYGPNLVLFGFLPLKAAYNASFLLHFAAGGLFSYLYMKRRGVGAEGAAVTALAFTFGSAYAGCFYNIVTMRTLVWFPLELVLIDLFYEKRKAVYLWGWAAVQGQVWLGGFPQTAAYAALFSGLYFLCGPKTPRSLVLFAAAAAASVLVGAPQLWATWELASHSTRVAQDPAFALWGSASPLVPLTLFLAPWSVFLRSGVYIGVLPFLVLAALPGRAPRRYWVLAAAGFLLALGSYNPLYWLLVKLPGFSLLRNPSKFLFFTAFFLAAASGYAVDSFLRPDKGKGLCAPCVFGRARMWLAIFGASAVIAWAAAFLGGPVLIRFGEWYVDRFVAGRSYHPWPLATYLERLPVLLGIVRANLAPSNPYVWAPFGWGLLLLAITAAKGYAKKWGRVLFLFALIADLFLYGHCFFGTGFIGNLAPFPEVAHTETLPKDGRWADLKTGDFIFPPNRNILTGHATVGAYSPLIDRDYHELMKDFGVLDDSFGRPETGIGAWIAQKSLVDFIGVKYIAADAGTELPGYEKIREEAGTAFFRNPDAANEYAVIAEGSGAVPDVRLAIAVHESHFEAVEVDLDAPSLLVRKQVYDKGWKVFVDGHEQPLARAERAFQGARVGPGRHRVEFLFRPAYFIIGIWIYAAGFLVIALGIMLSMIGPSLSGERGSTKEAS